MKLSDDIDIDDLIEAESQQVKNKLTQRNTALPNIQTKSNTKFSSWDSKGKDQTADFMDEVDELLLE